MALEEVADPMPERDSEKLVAEAVAALQDLAARSLTLHSTGGGQQPVPDTVGLSGSIEDFPERFLAWSWLARVVRDRNGVPGPLTAHLAAAMRGVVHDPEMSEHESDVAAVLDAQERGDADQVDAHLAAFDSPTSQLPAMQMIVLTAREVLRQAAGHSHLTEVEVLEGVRPELRV